MKKFFRFWVPLTGIIAIFASIAYAHWLILPFGDNTYTDINTVPARPVALVFGGGMESEHVQTLMQTDRVLTAVELYRAGKVQKIIVTGDDGARNFDEVSAMKALAVDSGVPAADVIKDTAGYRTYESCYRAKHVLQVDSVIAISQKFHLARINYLCSRQGIDTIGFAADHHAYGSALVRAHVREVFARVKAWWQADVTHPLPTSLEPPRN